MNGCKKGRFASVVLGVRKKQTLINALEMSINSCLIVTLTSDALRVGSLQRLTQQESPGINSREIS